MNTYYQSESLENFQMVLEKAFGLSLSDATSRSLYALCRGCLPLARTLSKSTIDKEDLTGDIIEIWQARLPSALLECFDAPSELTLQVIQILLKLGPLPISALESTPTLSSEMHEVLALDTWFNNNRGVISLRYETLSRLVLDFFPIPSSKMIIEHLIGIFENRVTCCDKVIAAALLIGNTELAEDLLKRYSTHLLSQLKLQALRQLTDQLDDLKSIQNPRLLFNCSCCHFLLGNIEASRSYFKRVINNLKLESENTFAKIIPENERAAFFAGVVLYAKFTDISLKDNLQLTTYAQKNLPISTMSTFLKVYGFSSTGQLDKLNKVLRAGLLRCESLNENSLYVVLAMLYFWSLLLSCRHCEAIDFIEQAKLYLLKNSISYKGAHEWLQLMDMLRLRLKGDLFEVEHLAHSYLKNDSFAKDSIRSLYLKILLIESKLVRLPPSDIKLSFPKLIALQHESFHLTYWLPTAVELHRIHELLLGGDVKNTITMAVAEEQLSLGVKAQANLLSALKIQLYRQNYLDLYPIIQRIVLVLTESSQWLRRSKSLF